MTAPRPVENTGPVVKVTLEDTAQPKEMTVWGHKFEHIKVTVGGVAQGPVDRQTLVDTIKDLDTIARSRFETQPTRQQLLDCVFGIKDKTVTNKTGELKVKEVKTKDQRTEEQANQSFKNIETRMNTLYGITMGNDVSSLSNSGQAIVLEPVGTEIDFLKRDFEKSKSLVSELEKKFEGLQEKLNQVSEDQQEKIKEKTNKLTKKLSLLKKSFSLNQRIEGASERVIEGLEKKNEGLRGLTKNLKNKTGDDLQNAQQEVNKTKEEISNELNEFKNMFSKLQISVGEFKNEVETLETEVTDLLNSLEVKQYEDGKTYNFDGEDFTLQDGKWYDSDGNIYNVFTGQRYSEDSDGNIYILQNDRSYINKDGYCYNWNEEKKQFELLDEEPLPGNGFGDTGDGTDKVDGGTPPSSTESGNLADLINKEIDKRKGVGGLFEVYAKLTKSDEKVKFVKGLVDKKLNKKDALEIILGINEAKGGDQGLKTAIIEVAKEYNVNLPSV